MRRKLQVGLLLGLLTGWCALGLGEVADRIVATVNGHVILQSDWDEALCYQALAEGRPAGEFSVSERKAALDRLIDQELIRQQVQAADFPAATSAEVDARIRELRKPRPEWASDEGWRVTLNRYGLSEDAVRMRVANEIDELRALDAHFRPGLLIDAKSVEAYYQEKLLPELRAAGAKEVRLEDVAPKIKELLAQQKMNDLLVGWLKTLRAESQIRTPLEGDGGVR
jgi:peptidyl-prolyl cis-trans isomerase SurA